MKITTTLTLALLLGAASAQSGQLPIPSFATTYSTLAGARGFHFQAPVDFEITGLRVPDEKKIGTQNVAAYVLAAQPLSNVTATPVFFAAGKNSQEILPVSIKVKKGQWFAVLGCAGDAQTQHTSYAGVNSHRASILGNPVTLQRSWTNTNMITMQGQGTFGWSNEPLGRVEVFVKGQDPIGRGQDFGIGTSSTPSGSPFLKLDNFVKTETGTQARGFWFKVPTQMIVLGLRVPNENKQKQQVVGLYRFTQDPGTMSTPTAADLAFYKNNAAADQLIPISPPVIYKKDEWFAVLGACHDGTQMSVSTSATTMRSSVLGNDLTLFPCFSVGSNLLTNSGIGQMAFPPTYSAGRVEVLVAGQSAFPPYYVPELTTLKPPVLGKTAELGLEANIPGTQGGLLFASFKRLPTPLPTPFGTLRIDPNFWATVLVPGGSGQIQMPIPNDKSLWWLHLQFQALTFDATTPTFALSNGTEWILGG